MDPETQVPESQQSQGENPSSNIDIDCLVNTMKGPSMNMNIKRSVRLALLKVNKDIAKEKRIKARTVTQDAKKVKQQLESMAITKAKTSKENYVRELELERNNETPQKATSKDEFLLFLIYSAFNNNNASTLLEKLNNLPPQIEFLFSEKTINGEKIDIDMKGTDITVDDDIKYVYDNYVTYFEWLAIKNGETFFTGLDSAYDSLVEKFNYRPCNVRKEKEKLKENLRAKFAQFQVNNIYESFTALGISNNDGMQCGGKSSFSTSEIHRIVTKYLA